jgi:hypothetical protein
VNDLKDQNKIAFYGQLRMYRGRLRKVFEVFNKRKKKPVKKRKKAIVRKGYPPIPKRSLKSKKKK